MLPNNVNLHQASGAALLLRLTGDCGQGIRLTTTNPRLVRKNVELGQKVGKRTVVVAAR